HSSHFRKRKALRNPLTRSAGFSVAGAGAPARCLGSLSWRTAKLIPSLRRSSLPTAACSSRRDMTARLFCTTPRPASGFGRSRTDGMGRSRRTASNWSLPRSAAAWVCSTRREASTCASSLLTGRVPAGSWVDSTIRPSRPMVAWSPLWTTGFSLFDLRTGKRVATCDDARCHVAFSPDSKWLACTRKNVILLLDARTLKVIREFRHTHWWYVGVRCFTPDGKKLIVGIGASISVLDLTTGKLPEPAGHFSTVES